MVKVERPVSYRKVRFSKSLHSLVRKRISRWFGRDLASESEAPEIKVEMVRTADSPWVRCRLELRVQRARLSLQVEQLARGPQQALEACLDQLSSQLSSSALPGHPRLLPVAARA